MKFHFNFILLFFCFFSFQKLLAQNSPVSSGASAIGSGGSSSYSVGQIVYLTNYGENISAIEGNQQPFEIIFLSNYTSEAINLGFSAYPNPTKNNLNLSFADELDLENMTYELFDLTGKIIISKTNIKSSKQIIYLANYQTGLYFLSIIKGNEIIKSFKIIKN